MIPYFSFHSFSLGTLTIQIWGLFVALGFLTGLIIFWQKSRQKNLPADQILNLSFWIVLCSLFFARLFYVLLGGELNLFLAKPWLFFALWQGGMSSIGGFFGAGLVLLRLCGSRGAKFCAPTIWPYIESMAYAFPFGWMIGRLGCFFIHDHLGRLTDSFFGVNFPPGARFDMALLEILTILPLAVIFLCLSRKEQKTKNKEQFYSIWLLLWYGATRFFLDFWRASDLPFSDPRYWGLTLGQWGGIGLIIIGFLILKALNNSFSRPVCHSRFRGNDSRNDRRR